jgi:aminomethyltransferase
MAEATLHRTPLYAEHVALNAKIVPFAGYEMPVQYPAGITAEHQAVRNAAGLFDVSHMGEFIVRGERALELVQHVTTNDASKIEVGQAQYSTLCNENGFLLDDLLVYRFPDRYMLVVNGSNREKDWAWVSRFAGTSGWSWRTDRRHRAARAAGAARAGDPAPADGPRPGLDPLLPLRRGDGGRHARDHLAHRLHGRGRLRAVRRRGRRGGALEAAAGGGEEDGLLPPASGCRDSLRLEMGYALYGNDLDEARTPLEAGLAWVTKLDKGDFVGRDALRRQKEEGVKVRLAGFKLRERGFPRHGYPVEYNGERSGEVTSGTMSPTLGFGVGLAYVPVAAAKPGTEIGIVIRDRAVAAEVVRPPFHTGGTVRS